MAIITRAGPMKRLRYSLVVTLIYSVFFIFLFNFIVALENGRCSYRQCVVIVKKTSREHSKSYVTLKN